jgi:hypothetical protein
MRLKRTFKKISLFILTIFFFNNSFSQTGNITATFTPDGVYAKPLVVNFSKPSFKFDNPHGYWFLNPHNGYRHFNVQPDQGYGNTEAAFITFNNSENDFDFYSLNDSIQVMLKKGGHFITAPEYDPKKGTENKPMHIHINSITAGEISFTISGTAAMGTEEGNGSMLGLGTINATGHFYREAKYDRSASLAGCDCDATIYAAVYDKEEGLRTTSACENALANKLFDAMQKATAPLFANVDFHGKGGLKPGEISIGMIAGHTDLNTPAKERPYCFSDYYHNRITGIDAQKRLYNNEDSYGLRMITIPEDKAKPDFKAIQQKQIAIMDSMNKLFIAKKISSEQYGKAIEKFSSTINDASGLGDIKKDEAESNLYITFIFNPSNRETMLMKLSDKSNTVVQHTINGSAFEIFSPLKQDSDRSWLSSKLYIYFGKFTPPVAGRSSGGFDAEVTTAVYPQEAAKLGIYNIIIKMEGGKALMEKAVANIDFSTLNYLITNNTK